MLLVNNSDPSSPLAKRTSNVRSRRAVTVRNSISASFFPTQEYRPIYECQKLGSKDFTLMLMDFWKLGLAARTGRERETCVTTLNEPRVGIPSLGSKLCRAWI